MLWEVFSFSSLLVLLMCAYFPWVCVVFFFFFFFQAEDGIRDVAVTGVQTCALPISIQRSWSSWSSLLLSSRSLSASHFAVRPPDSRVVMYRSSRPLPPGRSAVNRSVRPSADRLGCASLASVLTGNPRLMGVLHGAPNAGRVVTQMSCEPAALPGRSDDRNSSRPSKRIVGRKSLPSLLSSSTRTAGPNVPPGPSALTKIWRVPPGPTRSLATYNSGSRRVIPPSNPALFTSGPRLTGVSHAKSSFVLARHETQMSL